ncbi:MAG: WD40 repeat domain-containing protein [Pirellulaceae bacterium]
MAKCFAVVLLMLAQGSMHTDAATVLRQPEVIEGSAGRILAIAVSADGDRIATAGYDIPGDDSGNYAIRIWDLATKKQVRMISANCDSINAIAFSPDGSRVAVGDRDGTVACWNVQTGKFLFQSASTEAETQGVVFSANGKFIISGSDKYYSLDGNTGRKLGELKTHDGWAVNCMAISDDGKLIVSTCGSEGVVLRAANMSTMHLLRGHSRSVDVIAISKDTKRIATGCYDGSIKLWDTASGKELTSIKAHSADGVVSLAFFCQDRYLASGGQDGKLRIWNVATGEAEQSIDATTLVVDAIAATPDGKTLINSDIIRIQVRQLTKDRSVGERPPMARAKRGSESIDLSSLDQWEIARGEWKQNGKAIIGVGNSRVNSKQTFPNGFLFRCKLKVNGPTNPRIRFGSFHFGYEGDNKQFFLHGPKATGQRFSFEFGRTYQIEVTMREDKATLHIDDKEVASSNPKQVDRRTFSLEGGGIRSLSSAEFSEITVEPIN